MEGSGCAFTGGAVSDAARRDFGKPYEMSVKSAGLRTHNWILEVPNIKQYDLSSHNVWLCECDHSISINDFYKCSFN
jgi:hypothetical protein